MFRVGIITQSGNILGETFNTKEEAENYILSLMEKENLRQARIKNLNTKEEEKII